jgi:hypothetical protein
VVCLIISQSIVVVHWKFLNQKIDDRHSKTGWVSVCDVGMGLPVNP